MSEVDIVEERSQTTIYFNRASGGGRARHRGTRILSDAIRGLITVEHRSFVACLSLLQCLGVITAKDEFEDVAGLGFASVIQ
jgi:hypothetical protein